MTTAKISKLTSDLTVATKTAARKTATIKVEDIPSSAQKLLEQAGVTHVLFGPGQKVDFRFRKMVGKAGIRSEDFPVAAQEILESHGIKKLTFTVEKPKVGIGYEHKR